MSTPIDTKVPPPVLLLALCVAAWWLARTYPQAHVALPLHIVVGAGLIAAGLMLNLYPGVSFSRAKTTVNPMRPGSSTALVTTGLYRFTRNPMYLGHALILLGYAYLLSNAFGFLTLPLHIAYITMFQIIPEERALFAKFGDDYADYRRRVRRWL